MQLSPIGKTQYPSRFKRTMTLAALFVIAFIIIFTYSKTAHAGLLSFMNSILGGEQASAKIDLPAHNMTSQTIALLQPAVNIDPNPNKPGNIVPVDKNALVADISAAEASDTEVNSQISVYTVREGDTLSAIAQMFKVSVNTIMWSNDLERASGIQPGQTLVILPVSGINYNIKKGDTIKGIVISYKADLQEVLQYNDLTLDSVLVAGQTIMIPDAELQTAVAPKSVARTSKISAGYYIRPIIGGVRTQGIHGNNGVDLASSFGTPIMASASGDVIISKNDSGWHGGYGKYIVLRHGNGTQTVYAHLSSTLVSVGEHVTQGDVIGKMGNTGNVKGPTGIHLHFEIWNGPPNPF